MDSLSLYDDLLLGFIKLYVTQDRSSIYLIDTKAKRTIGTSLRLSKEVEYAYISGSRIYVELKDDSYGQSFSLTSFVYLSGKSVSLYQRYLIDLLNLYATYSDVNTLVWNCGNSDNISWSVGEQLGRLQEQLQDSLNKLVSNYSY